MDTPSFCRPIDGPISTLSAPHLIGTNIISLTDPTRLGEPTSQEPVRLTVISGDGLAILTQFVITSVQGFEAAATVDAGYADAYCPAGSIVAATASANAFHDIHAAVGNLVETVNAVSATTGAAGMQGIQGPPGPEGPEGPAGPTGLTGPAGAQGLAGPAGAVGPAGPKGESGIAGPQGAKGDVGPTGPQGDTGLQGSQGPVGLTGATGATGATGSQGPQGVKGDTGPAGAAGPAGSDATSDLFASLVYNEVVVNGETTLTGSHYGHSILCNAASNFPVTLPDPVAGKVIGLRISHASTGLVTLQASSGSIDGQPARILWANESAILLGDGTDWAKIAGRTVPMVGSASRVNSDVNITSSRIWTNIAMNNYRFGPSAMWDAANGRLITPRAGTYSGSAFVYDNSTKTGFFAIGIGQNSVNGDNVGGYTNSPNDPRTGAYASGIMANVGDYFWPVCYADQGAAILTTSPDAVPKITLIEIPSW